MIKIKLFHEMSPLPILGAFVGLWMPVDWLLNYSNIKGASPLEICYALAASVVFNYGLIAFIFIMFGMLLFIFNKKIYLKWNQFVFWGVVFACFKHIFMGGGTLPSIINWSINIIIIILIILMVWKLNYIYSSIFRIPVILSLMLLLASFVFVGCEWFGIGVVKSIRTVKPNVNSPDILFISLDATSASHLTPFGAPRDTSPNLQAFANQATVLENFYANANWTRPGVASLLDGARPWTHWGDLGTPDASIAKEQNLVKTLCFSGYNNSYVGTNPFAMPYIQKCDAYFENCQLSTSLPYGFGLIWRCAERFPSLLHSFTQGPLPLFVKRLDYRVFQNKTIPPIVDVETQMKQLGVEHPGFFWLHLLTDHDPFAAPPPFLGFFDASMACRSVRTTYSHYGFGAGSDPRYHGLLEARYDEAIRCMDDGLGRLFAWMKATGRYDRTLIVITADHGESFTHGYGGHGGPLLTEDLIHIPCLIKRPYQHTAERDDRLYEQCDLAPTMLQMAGLPVPPGMEGYPISQKPEGLPVFAMNHDLQAGTRTFSVAIRLGDWKYVEHWGKWTAPWPQRELYDLASDPGEDRNLVSLRPDKAADLRGRILAELARRHIDPEKE